MRWMSVLALEIETFDDVDVPQLCALPITEQRRIVDRVKQIEADRSTEELLAAHGAAGCETLGRT